jgi:membrane-associated protease RseP (regulator of RpoE activity)
METKSLHLHIVLFFLTFLTLTYRESLFSIIFLFDWQTGVDLLLLEWSYSVPLLLILLCHEMGHYVPARFYSLRATLPYFIPIPINPIGTMGAVIRIKDPIPDKKKLFDIGVGGPLLSFILSVPVWIIGLYLSELVPLSTIQSWENSIRFGDSIFTYWTGQLILGPYSPEEFDILIHPLARAGWVGLIITAINLLPFGQLDGGHIIYSIFGERYRSWIYYLFLCLVILSLFHFSWLVWAFLIFYIIKIEHPFVPDSPTGEIGKSRVYLGLFMLVSLIFIFVPFPLEIGDSVSRNTLIGDLLRWIF